MRRMGWKITLCAALVAAGALAPADAALVTVSFQGRLSTAENNRYDDPDIPQGDFFFVGQRFSGALRYDTDLPGDVEPDIAVFELLGFDLFFGNVDYSDRFIPRLIGRSQDGTIEFLSGGADQGGSASLSLNLGSFSPDYPSLSQLNGQSALFSYEDFTPLGGSLSGTATLGTAVASVPETTTWAMMIAGVGVVGGAARRRRTVEAQARFA